MKIQMPWWGRMAIYVTNILLAPVVIYALDKGWIGGDEVKLWAAEIAAAFTLAGLNISQPRQ